MIFNPYAGSFFVTEGIDGSGKTTQLGFLAHWLASQNLEVFQTKEPDKKGTYGRLIYEDLLDPNGLHVRDPKLLQSWYACDSRQNVENRVIGPISSPSRRNVVVCDRFRTSMVYGAKSAKDIPELMASTQSIMGHLFIWPDAIFIFDVSVQTALRRLKEKGRPVDGFENQKKLMKVRGLYRAFAKKYPGACYIISAEEDPGTVARRVRRIAQRVLIRKGQWNLSPSDE